MKKSCVLPGVKWPKRGSATPTIVASTLLSRTERPTEAQNGCVRADAQGEVRMATAAKPGDFFSNRNA
jgi:hypothetical protein